MSRPYLVAAGALAAVFAAALLGAVPAAGQAQDDGAYTVSRTPWGDPDFQGSWENRSPVPLERPAEFGDREFMTEEEAAERANSRVGLPDGEEGVIADDLVAADVQRVERSNNIDPNRPGCRRTRARSSSSGTPGRRRAPTAARPTRGRTAT